MKRDGKLSLALHALGHMARDPARTWRSEDLAALQGTNPVVVRRVLAPLREAGILRSGRGRAGGWRLGRDPASVTVAEVHALVGERLLPEVEREGGGCAIVATMREAVAGALAEAEAALDRRLGAVTVADLAGAVPPAPRAPEAPPGPGA